MQDNKAHRHAPACIRSNVQQSVPHTPVSSRMEPGVCTICQLGPQLDLHSAVFCRPKPLPCILLYTRCCDLPAKRGGRLGGGGGAHPPPCQAAHHSHCQKVLTVESDSWSRLPAAAFLRPRDARCKVQTPHPLTTLSHCPATAVMQKATRAQASLKGHQHIITARQMQRRTRNRAGGGAGDGTRPPRGSGPPGNACLPCLTLGLNRLMVRFEAERWPNGLETRRLLATVISASEWGQCVSIK